jgi:Tol biopolymer transport system component
MRLTKTKTVLIAIVALAAPVAAYHRQTPPIVPLTSSGDSALPRVPAGGRRLVLVLDAGGHQIFRHDRAHNLFEQLTSAGDNTDPTISASGSVIAWDSDCSLLGCAEPGRQIFLWANGRTTQVTHDPTGTSAEPSLSGSGGRLAFESLGDLAGTGNAGVRQIFLRGSNGAITQVSHGAGASRNPALDRGGLNVVYESSNDAAGNDTGTVQVWLAPARGGSAPVTGGASASRRPTISSDGRLIAFESTAALTGDGHDTGVSQIYLYDVAHRLFSQITNDAGGCAGASIEKIPRDWTVGFVCHGEGFFHHLVANRRYRLPIAGGDTPQAIAELGAHFMVVSTTANLLGGGTTPGHQLYMLNLFKLAAEPVS